MIALIDTNVVLDVLLKREPFFNDSIKIMEMSENGKIKGYITSNSITDIAYISKRGGISQDRILQIIKNLIQILDVVSVTRTDIIKAIELGYKDFEDAVQAQCAKKIKADYIITRNKKDFFDKRIKILTPKEFLEECEERV